MWIYQYYCVNSYDLWVTISGFDGIQILNVDKCRRLVGMENIMMMKKRYWRSWIEINQQVMHTYDAGSCNDIDYADDGGNDDKRVVIEYTLSVQFQLTCMYGVMWNFQLQATRWFRQPEFRLSSKQNISAKRMYVTTRKLDRPNGNHIPPFWFLAPFSTVCGVRTAAVSLTRHYLGVRVVHI
jgi:hypothetical protein